VAVTAALCLVAGFFFDARLVDVIAGAFPASAHEWLGIIRVASWFFVLWLTFGVIVFFTWAISLIVAAIID
jgi:hypothetical protein